MEGLTFSYKKVFNSIVPFVLIRPSVVAFLLNFMATCVNLPYKQNANSGKYGERKAGCAVLHAKLNRLLTWMNLELDSLT